MKLDVSDLKVPAEVKATVALVLVLYSTLGIYFLKKSPRYMDFFTNKVVVMFSILLTAGIGYANPSLGVIALIALMRTVNIVAEKFMDSDNFEVLQYDTRVPVAELISTDGSLHTLAKPGSFPTAESEKTHVQVLESAGDNIDEITSKLLGLNHAGPGEDPVAVSLDSQFGLSFAAPPGSKTSPVPTSSGLPATDSQLVTIVPTPAADMPVSNAEQADVIVGPAPGAPATVPVGSAQPSDAFAY